MRVSRVLLICITGASLLGFATPAAADDEPSVVTLSPTGVTESAATVRAHLNPEDEETVYRFEYGTSSYTNDTPVKAAGEGDDWLLVSEGLTGLQPATTYRYRIVAQSSEGVGRGRDVTFTTASAPSPSPPPTPPADGGSTPPEGNGSPSGPVGPDQTIEGDDEGVSPAPESRGVRPTRSVAAVEPKGRVLVRLPGRTGFVALGADSPLPYGSELDTTAGSVQISSVLPSGKIQTGRFGGGRFVMRRGARGYVNLHLRGPVCPGATRERAKASSVVASASRRSRRRLWGRDRGGRFRTYGKNSHATVRGTRWLVSDSCAGTLTKVSDGAVVVRNLGTGKRKLVRAGERYLAPPRG